jgi:hypothetical protein
MASQDPPTNVIQASLQTLVYETTKVYFLNLAKMLEKGGSLPVLTNDRAVVTSMPTGKGYHGARDLIAESFKRLRARLSQQSEWKEVRFTLGDKDDREFFNHTLPL